MQPLPPFVDTRGGNFFYRLHFDLHYIDVKTARWIVCFASLFMLIALISGIVIHKRIFKDMFVFRANKGSRIISPTNTKDSNSYLYLDKMDI